jgi:two-component system phosphate regulon sensor histidine kinase PhoR
MLMFTAYSYFRQTGLVLSTSVLVFVGIIDSIRYLQDPQEIISIGLSVLATVTVGLAIVSISRTQEVDNAELTRTKALESLQRDRILTLINNLADAILSTDRDGIIRVYNAASLNLLNTNSSLDGQSIEDVLPLRDKNKKAIKLFRDLKKSHSVVMRDDLTLTQEGETIRLELTYSPIRSSFSRSKKSEKQDGYILILRDITKAKSLEEERDEFISVVSHELRTPLSIAEGTISNVQVMLDRGSIAKSVLKSGVQAAHDQMIFLSKMVNDLSTLSRAERGAADAPEVIAIRDLVDDLYKEYAPQAEKKGLRFDLDLSPELGTITASPLYLKEMIQNFITNSIKYTKEGGVTLRVMRKDNDITFDVRDTGIGISKSDQPRVFTKFFRSEDYRTRETGGTGLGLYVSAKLAKKLDTHITLVSRLNHGSSFSFTLTDKENKPAIR